MKKLVSMSLVLTSLLYSATLDIKKGWNNIGSSEGFSVQNKFESMPEIQSVWRYDNATSSWEFYSPDTDLQATATAAGYGKIPALSSYSGIWIQSSADKSIVDFDTNIGASPTIFKPTTIQKYDNNSFGYGTYDNKVAFGISKDGGDWDELFSINYSDYYSDYYSKQFINNDDKASFVTVVRNKKVSADGNTAYTTKMYGLVYENGVVNKTELATIDNGYINFIYSDIFTKYDDNNTQIVLPYVQDYNNRNDNALYVYETNNSKWNLVKTINNDSSSYTSIDYDWQARYNTNGDSLGSYKYLKSFSIYDEVNHKTNFYDATNNYKEYLSLDGKWQERNSYSTDENTTYKILLRSNYAEYNNGKEIDVIENKSLFAHKKFDHTIRAFTTVYVNNNSYELFAFTHDEIGENLYIYNSTDNGTNWTLFKTIDNFNYQINYIRSTSYDRNTEDFSCELYVNDDTQVIKSSDNLATWSLVQENNRPNLSSTRKVKELEKAKWIKRQNIDGSFTLIPKN